MTAEREFWRTFDNNNQSYIQVIYGVFDIYTWSCTQATFEPDEERDQNEGDTTEGRDGHADENRDHAQNNEGNFNEDREEEEHIPEQQQQDQNGVDDDLDEDGFLRARARATTRDIFEDR